MYIYIYIHTHIYSIIIISSISIISSSNSFIDDTPRTRHAPEIESGIMDLAMKARPGRSGVRQGGPKEWGVKNCH